MTDKNKKPYLVITNVNRTQGAVKPDEIEFMEFDEENATLISLENFNIIISMEVLLGKALIFMQSRSRDKNGPDPNDVLGEE